MSVSATASKVQFLPGGATTAFAYPYPYLSQVDLVVVLTTAGVDATLVLGVDYTVSSTGVSLAGGTVNMTAPPAAGTVLTIKRVLALTQQQSYTPNAAFPASATEQALDRLTLICQQLLELFGRCIVFPAGEAIATNPSLGSATQRANQVLQFDTNGAILPGPAAINPSYLDPATGDLVMNNAPHPGVLHMYSTSLVVRYNSVDVATFGAPGLALQQLGQTLMILQGDKNSNAGLVFAQLAAGTVNISNANITGTAKLFAFGQDTNVTGILKLTARDNTAHTCTIASSVGGDSGFIGLLILDNHK